MVSNASSLSISGILSIIAKILDVAIDTSMKYCKSGSTTPKDLHWGGEGAGPFEWVR